MSSPTPKKRDKKPSSSKPTQSFAQLMSDAQLKAVTKQVAPYIDARINEMGSFVAQKVAKLLLDNVASIQNRQLATERLLKALISGFTNELLSYAIIEVEDEALGLKAVDVAKSGDTVRIKFWSSYEGESFPEEPELIRIDSLLREVEGRVQTDLKELEEAVLGMAVGSQKQISFQEDDEKAVNLKIELVKASRKEEKDVANSNA